MNLVINRAVINGIEITRHAFVSGSAVLKYAGQDRKIVTLDHVIHNVRQCVFTDSSFEAFGNVMQIENTSVATDSANFAVPCSFYYNATLVMQCRALVTCSYSNNDNITKVELKGEAN